KAARITLTALSMTATEMSIRMMLRRARNPKAPIPNRTALNAKTTLTGTIKRPSSGLERRRRRLPPGGGAKQFRRAKQTDRTAPCLLLEGSPEVHAPRQPAFPRMGRRLQLGQSRPGRQNRAPRLQRTASDCRTAAGLLRPVDRTA